MTERTPKCQTKNKNASAKQRRLTEEGGAVGAARSTRSVTRVESTEAGRAAERVLIDWLNVTFPAPAFEISKLIECLAVFLGCYVSGIDTGRGLHGFKECVRLWAYVAGDMVEIGNLAYGGTSQRGRWFLQLTGKGCGLVKDWRTFETWLEELDAGISRVDIAADFMQGQYSVDDAVQMYKEGGFTSSGRPPKTRLAGDWIDNREGRTLYIGKAGNGKMLRCYEKGKELGDLESDWVRFEVQLGNRDRVIPLEVLTQPERYFAGAYPALQQLLEHVEGESIRTCQTEGKKTLANLLYHLKRCYGKALHVAATAEQIDLTELVEEVRMVGIPRRLDPASVVAGLNWRTVSAELRRYDKCRF